jgi:amino acid transporter
LLIFIYVIITCIVAVVLVKLIDKFLPANARTFVSIALWVVCFFIAYLIYASIMKPIEFNKEKEARYEIAVKTMLDIKKLQTGYKSVHGKFAENFDELIKFVEEGQFEIISRKDTVIIDAARNAAFGITVGADGVGGFYKDVVLTDKLGSVSVKDSLFKNSDRYKKLNVVKIGNIKVPVIMKTGLVNRNDMNISVFEAKIDKNALLKDLDQDLVKNENKVESIDEINGPEIILGSLEEVSLTGNWPKKYGSNE